MAKKLVAYFSASGKTAETAEKLAGIAGADIYRIKPQKEYTKADLNWLNPKSRSSVEMREGLRPEIITGDIDIAGYGTVYIGFPIWWYVAPTVINAFLESYDFGGKRIVLFATSGGSGFGKTVSALKSSAPNAEIIEGKILNKRAKDEDYTAVADLG